MAPKKGGEPSLLSKLSSYLVNPFKRGPPPKTPIGGIGDRIINIGKNNFRGLIGVIVPICVLLPQFEKMNKTVKVKLMWMWLFWFYLWQPVAIPNTALIPVFYLPMLGIMMSSATCGCYMNENVMLFVLAGWLIVTLNNSGVDKRIALWFLTAGDNSQYSGQKLVFKAGTAAFFLSMFSSRLITTLTLTELMTTAFTKADPSGKGDATAIRHVVNNAVQTSSSIGGTAIIHSSYINLLARGCFHEYAPKDAEYPDIFNYLTYSVFAFPMALVCLIINLGYHTVLVGKVTNKGLSEPQRKEVQAAIKRKQAEIPNSMSLHEVFSIVGALGYLLVSFFRWAPAFGIGWASFSEKTPTLPGVKDATVGALFAIVLHIIPKGFGFLQIFSAKKKSQLALKPESAVLWWRFVDKNVNYGYIFSFGCCFALTIASREVELDHEISAGFRSFIEMDFNIGLLVCLLIGAVLSNVMSSIAACTLWLPFVLCMAEDGPFPWSTKEYLAVLGIGVVCNFGFCTPFQYTPAYYEHRTGKVRPMTMIKYNVIPVVYCTIIAYLFLIFVAEPIFDKNASGFLPLLTSKTAAAGAATTTSSSSTASTTDQAGR